MVVDQVGCVDQIDGVSEAAVADQADPQAVVPEHGYHFSPPPALDCVQDLVDDAEPGGEVPEPGDDDDEYVEFPDGPPIEPKQELQDEDTPADAQVRGAGMLDPALPTSHKF